MAVRKRDGDLMKKKLGRKIFLVLVALVIVLIAAIVGPFMRYKEITKETKENFHVEDFRSNQAGPDRAQLLETNTSAWEERIRLFNRARERIIMSTFDIRPGQSAQDVLAMLLHKAEEGVKVQILVDGVSGLIRMEGEELFYAVSSHPNAEIKIYNRLNFLTPWTSQGRMHDKYIIVDDLAYILGGRNTFDYFIGDYSTKNRSRDREVLVYNTKQGEKADRSSSLWQVEAYFEKVWNLDVCTYFHNEESLREREDVQAQITLLEERYDKIKKEHPDLFQETNYGEQTVPTNQVRLISNPTGIYAKEPVVFYELSELMKQAKEQVIIHTPYAVCNGYMYDTLEEICEMVPDVHMLVNSVENGDNIVASSDYLKYKGKLLDTGIRIMEYDGGESYHGKSIVIDEDLAVVGSYNLDLRSSYVDTELMLVINSKEFTAELKEAMAEMERDCRTVIDKNTYDTPEHIQVAEVPFGKRILWIVLGIVLHPFRVMI